MTAARDRPWGRRARRRGRAPAVCPGPAADHLGGARPARARRPAESVREAVGRRRGRAKHRPPARAVALADEESTGEGPTPGGGPATGEGRHPAAARRRAQRGGAPAGVAVTTVQRPATAGERARASVGHAGAPVWPASEAPPRRADARGQDRHVHTELSAALDGLGWRRPSSKASMADSAAGRSQGRPVTVPPAPPIGHHGSSARPTARLDPGRAAAPAARRRRHGRALASATWRATATVCSASDRHRSGRPRPGHVSLGHEALQARQPRAQPGPAAQHVGVDRRAAPRGWRSRHGCGRRQHAPRPTVPPARRASGRLRLSPRPSGPTRQAPATSARVDSIRVSSSTAPSGSSRCAREERR